MGNAMSELNDGFLEKGPCSKEKRGFDPVQIGSMSGLGDKQRLFLWCMSKFLTYIYVQGCAVTAGDFSRKDNRGHMIGSMHYDRLASDLNLFVLDESGTWDYIESYDEAPFLWDRLGVYWKKLHPLCRWGGDFESRDLNHFSITAWGRA